MKPHVRRRTQVITTAIVAAFCAAASFTHITELAHRHGQDEWIALGYPLAVDGMLLVGSLNLANGKRGWRPVLAFIVGVCSSLAANVLVAPPDLLSQIISAFPAVSLLITVEVIIHNDDEAPAGGHASPAGPDVVMAAPATPVTAAAATNAETTVIAHGGREVEAAMNEVASGHEPGAATVEKAPHQTAATGTAEPVDREQSTEAGDGAKTQTTKRMAARCHPANGTDEGLAAAAAEFLAAHPKATGAEVAKAIGRSVRTGRRYRVVGLELLAARNGHGHEAAATYTTDLAEDLAEVVTGHAEDMAEFGHDLIENFADMAAVG
jgi:hypothetical protein